MQVKWLIELEKQQKEEQRAVKLKILVGLIILDIIIIGIAVALTMNLIKINETEGIKQKAIRTEYKV